MRKFFICILFVISVFCTPVYAQKNQWKPVAKERNGITWYIKLPPYKKQSDNSYIVWTKCVFPADIQFQEARGQNFHELPINYIFLTEYKFDGSKYRILEWGVNFKNGTSAQPPFNSLWNNIFPDSTDNIIWEWTHKQMIQ